MTEEDQDGYVLSIEAVAEMAGWTNDTLYQLALDYITDSGMLQQFYEMLLDQYENEYDAMQCSACGVLVNDPNHGDVHYYEVN